MAGEVKCLDCGQFIEDKHGTVVCAVCTQKRIDKRRPKQWE